MVSQLYGEHFKVLEQRKWTQESAWLSQVEGLDKQLQFSPLEDELYTELDVRGSKVSSEVISFRRSKTNILLPLFLGSSITPNCFFLTTIRWLYFAYRQTRTQNNQLVS